MKAQTLLPSKALESGADLWVIPDRRTSSWSRKIDWYLQFLISKAMIHVSPQVSGQLSKQMQENDMDVFSHTLSHASPLLILSGRQLPNKKTVHLPFLGDHKTWVGQVYEIWNRFHSPGLRVFLPKGMEAKDFTQHWPKNSADGHVSVSFVLDGE
ncbi:MAG: hypothetical protein AB7F59_14765 [Bdellovibrionales bacterium]